MVIALLAVIGISVGVTVSKKHNKTAAAVNNGSPGSGGSGGGSGGGGSGPNNTNPNLKKVFWGIAYTPDWALPQFGCNITQGKFAISLGFFLTDDDQNSEQVTRDISVCKSCVFVFHQ